MSQKKRYDSVSQMVKECSDSREFADSFEHLLSQRQLIKQLLVMRASKGLSQEDMAREMKCSQSRISKLENSTDGDLSLTDISSYLAPLGYQVELLVSRQNMGIVEQVKYHWFQTKKLMATLVKMAGVDQPLATGIAHFFGEACCNYLKIILDSAKELPEVARREVPIFKMIEECESEPGTPEPKQIADECHHVNGATNGSPIPV